MKMGTLWFFYAFALSLCYSPVALGQGTLSAAFGLSQGTTTRKYLIMSMPKIKQIVYRELTGYSSGMRPLVLSNLQAPESIAVDQINMRLFIADKAQLKILWYILRPLPNGKLITDGIQRTAVEQVIPEDIAVNSGGDLIFSGKLIIPLPYNNPANEIFSVSAASLMQNQVWNPQMLWDRFTTSGKSWMPGPIAVDNVNILWSNMSMQTIDGQVVLAPAQPARLASAAPATQETTPPPSEQGTLGMLGSVFGLNTKTTSSTLPPPVVVSTVQGTGHIPPPVLPASAISHNVQVLAKGANSVYSLAITPRFLYYATDKAIMGMDKTKVTSTCAGDQCSVVEDTFATPTSMIWDGDGTIFIADGSKVNDWGTNGGVWSVPSGDRSKQLAKFVQEAPGIHGIGLLSVTSDANRLLGRVGVFLLGWLVVMGWM